MTTVVKEKQIYIPLEQPADTELLMAKERIESHHTKIKALQRDMNREMGVYYRMCRETASELVERGIFKRFPTCFNDQRGIDWFVKEIDEEIIIRQQGWLPFAHKVYGGYGYCGYFMLDYEQPFDGWVNTED